ncbi:hypothetical protein J2Z32_000745 [Paenibacillus turicensis]|uniref:Uncharacterized protein n=1 Tax=Paenibacillus turicensis TaxID=160487 RepID=A0ABS4FNI2_9BACL|nr:YlzJ-like family protein [Paenibacillus turicensis]MBP1904128.1 hypothetical protein [Paenibacillus turicensis]
MSDYYDPYPFDAYGSPEDQIQNYIEVDMNGVLMQVRMEGTNKATIIRLLRCNLDYYLDPAYAPGSQIIFTPQLMS